MAIKQEMAAPHIRRKRTTSAIMTDVVIALLPICVWAVWLFRWQAAAVLVTTTAVCVLADWLCLKLRGRGGFDGSGAVTGLLLGLSLPAGTAALGLAGCCPVFFAPSRWSSSCPEVSGAICLTRRWPAVRCCWLLCRRRWAATCARTPYLRLRRSPKPGWTPRCGRCSSVMRTAAWGKPPHC